MATVQTNAVIADASLLLQDTANKRWTKEELLGWLNSGQREIVLYKPNACVINVDMALVAGSKQSLPEGGNVLIDVPRNTGGNAITLASRAMLDAQMPDWHSMARKSAKAFHYCYSDSDPKHFYVYPPSPGGNSVEVIYNANPVNAVLGGAITVDDIYASALVDYVLYRAFSKDAEFSPNEQTASAHYQAFIYSIKGKSVAESSIGPNSRANPS